MDQSEQFSSHKLVIPNLMITDDITAPISVPASLLKNAHTVIGIVPLQPTISPHPCPTYNSSSSPGDMC